MSIISPLPLEQNEGFSTETEGERKMDIKRTTPGPWRWGDHSVVFGTPERSRHRRSLEHLPGAGLHLPTIRRRDDGFHLVLVVEDRLDEYKTEDLELVRRAPELAAALADMLSMFGGNMDLQTYAEYMALAGTVYE